MPTLDLVCHHCSQPFRARQRDDKPRRYCSRKCRDDHRTTRVTLTCIQCRQPFERKAYQADWSTERGPFCGMKCYGAWQALPSQYLSKHHLRQRDAALLRDGYQCVKCDEIDPEKLEVHHVVPWAQGQPDPHAMGNLVTLCVHHHRLAHMALRSALQP